MLRQEMEELGGIEKLRPLFEAKHPLGRICSPEEVARQPYSWPLMIRPLSPVPPWSLMVALPQDSS